LLAGSYRYVYFYEAVTFRKRVAIRKESRKEGVFSILGAGYIDDNTWYVATGKTYPNPDYKESLPGQNNYLHRGLTRSDISIRQIEPSRELYRDDLHGSGIKTVFANKNHIAYRWTMVNWRTGEQYKVDMPHPIVTFYNLTPDSQVVTKFLRRDAYLFYSPLKQEGVVWDFAFQWSDSNLMLSRDARYALVGTEKGGCELWQVAQKKRLGRCGRSKLWGDKITHAVFRRDSQAFVVSAENKITLYSIEPFKSLMTLVLKEPVDMLALNEEYFAAIDKAGMLRVWDINENKLLAEYRFSENHDGLAEFSSSSRQMAFQPGGSKLVVSNLSQLLVFDLADSLAGSNSE